MLDKQLVSIIIPFWNAERYIEHTILCALAQTWPNTELILIDDGSTDHSYNIALKYSFENVILKRYSNGGAATARNRGLALAKGTYIQFLDADDLISPDKIEKQMLALNGTDEFVCVGPSVHFPDGDDHRSILPVHEWYSSGTNDTADFLTKLYGGSIIGPEYGGMVPLHAWLIPLNLIHHAGNWNENLSLDDDGEFMCRTLLAAKGILYANEGITYYRKYLTAHNISSSVSYEAHTSLLTSTKLRMQHLLKRRDDSLSRSALSRIFCEIAVSFYPEYPLLTNEAEKIAKHLDPKLRHEPYTHFPLKQLTNIFGWRAAKLLSRFKNKWKKKLAL